MATETWAFIDEYGNPNLATEVPGASKFFVVAAVILDEASIDDVRRRLEGVREEHFQAGPMKSKKIGKDRKRWMAVLASLAPVPFRFYGLAIDKRALDRTSGLQWKQSFYKHTCGRVYGKLMQHFPALHVRADQYGRDDFKESFASYIEANHRPTLFDRGTFEFVEAKSDVAVQLADILCGTLARCYDPDMQLSAPEDLLGLPPIF